MSGPVVQLDAGQAAAVRYCVAETVRRRLLAGAPVPSWLRTLHDTLTAAGMSGNGPEPVGAEEQWVTTQQAADEIGCSARHIRRNAHRLGGHKYGRAWLIPRSAL
ncbi:MAG: helix-turn-helix domain-containing protein [Mycobacterium sp.]|nr:helix-turn-helix domain-containing protein [Mycobacterium sp.]